MAVPTILGFRNAFPIDNTLARSFNGTTDYINIPGLSGAAVSTPLTFSCWAYPTIVDTETIFGPFGASNPTGLQFRMTSVGGGAWQLVNSNVAILFTGQAVTFNTWSQLIVTYDGVTAFIYLNGSGVSGAASGLGSTNTAYLIGAAVGGAPPPAQFWNGKLADIALWNVVLNSTQVAALASGQRANAVGANANLVGYWPFTGASPEPDQSGNGNNGTLSGTTSLIGGPNLLQPLGSGIALPQHKASQSQVFNYLYPGALQPLQTGPAVLSYTKAFLGIPAPQHKSGQTQVQSFLYPGALQPLQPPPTFPFTLMPQIVT